MTEFDTSEWFFVADWCKKNGLSPYDSTNYNKAKEEYRKQKEKND